MSARDPYHDARMRALQFMQAKRISLVDGRTAFAAARELHADRVNVPRPVLRPRHYATRAERLRRMR